MPHPPCDNFDRCERSDERKRIARAERELWNNNENGNRTPRRYPDVKYRVSCENFRTIWSLEKQISHEAYRVLYRNIYLVLCRNVYRHIKYEISRKVWIFLATRLDILTHGSEENHFKKSYRNTSTKCERFKSSFKTPRYSRPRGIMTSEVRNDILRTLAYHFQNGEIFRWKKTL